MAVAAGRSVSVAPGIGLPMNALRVGLEGIRMTGGALYGFQFWSVGNLRDIAMTGRAIQRPMNGSGKPFSLDVERNGLARSDLLQPLDPVARKTDLPGDSLRLRKDWMQKNSNNKSRGP